MHTPTLVWSSAARGNFAMVWHSSVRCSYQHLLTRSLRKVHRGCRRRRVPSCLRPGVEAEWVVFAFVGAQASFN